MRKTSTVVLPAEKNRKYDIEIDCWYDTSYVEGGEVDMKLACALGQVKAFD